MSAGVVALAGTRSLPAGGVSLVSRVARALVANGRSLVVGCCVGADEIVCYSVAVGSFRVLAAFGPDGAGACPLSAVLAVQGVAAIGGSVSWWAGGGPEVPLKARLAARTQAVVGAASSGLVLFPSSSPESRGSWLAAHLAVVRCLPVVVFPLGFSGCALPLLGPGRWAPVASSGLWATAWRWVFDDFKSFFACKT